MSTIVLECSVNLFIKELITKQSYLFFLVVPGSDLGFNRTEFLRSLRDYLIGIYAPTWPDHEDDMFEAFNFYYTPWPHIEDRDLNREKFNQVSQS